MHPKVSIVIPVYKVENYLDRCVESLVNQVLKDIEIILVDDGSPDRCPQMCDEWAKRDDRIKVIHKQNAGLGMACNSGIDAAIGDYIAFCDSDDWVDEEMYAVMYQAAEENMADAVYTGLERHDGKFAVGRLPHPSSEELIVGRDRITDFMKDMIASRPNICIERRIQVSAKVVLYRKKIIDDNELRFENERSLISEDLLFNLDFLSIAKSVIVLPKFFYHYFVNETSITNSAVKDKKQDFEKFHIHISCRYSQLEGDKDFYMRVDRLFIGYIRSYMDFLVNRTNLSKMEKIQKLKLLCKCPNWETIKHRYPIAKMPLKHRIVMNMVAHGYSTLLYYLFKLSN